MERSRGHEVGQGKSEEIAVGLTLDRLGAVFGIPFNCHRRNIITGSNQLVLMIHHYK